MSTAIRVKELVAAAGGNDDHWRNDKLVADAIVALCADSKAAGDDPDDLLLIVETPRVPVSTIGRGVVLPIRGCCVHRRLTVSKIAIRVGRQLVPLRYGEPRDALSRALEREAFAHGRYTGFSGHVNLLPDVTATERDTTATFEIEFSGGSRATHRSRIAIVAREPQSPLAVEAYSVSVSDAGGELGHGEGPRAPSAPESPLRPSWSTDGARVFISMASYNPSTDGLRRQIDSIIAQTHKNWHLLINDDGSSPERWRDIQSVAALDERISVRQNPRNAGFYRNFELALCAAPESAQFVALADQDDDWYPEKLEALLRAMDDDVSLCYSDMQIRDANGSVLAKSYWQGRRNNYEHFDILLLANTVTGAASLFRRDLVDTLLPFPARIGDAFHDHWIACAAFATGRIAYVDRPLYDYIQHDESVVGHCDFETPGPSERLRRLRSRLLRWPRLNGIRQRLAEGRQSALAVHRFECRRIELICQTLLLRCPNLSTDKARPLRLYGRGLRSGIDLVLKHVSVVRRGQSTNDAEIRLALGYVADGVERMRNAVHRRTRCSRWINRSLLAR